MSSSPAYKPPPPPPSLAPPRPARETRHAKPTPKRRPTSTTPPPASDALQLLRGGAPSPSAQEHDTVEMRLDDPTVEMEAPAERARSVHRKLRAREKRQAAKPIPTTPTTPGAEKKRANARAKRPAARTRGSSAKPTRIAPPPREVIAGEKSGVRRKVNGKTGALARSSEKRPMARPSTRPPVPPPPAAQPPRRSAPPPVPPIAQKAQKANRSASPVPPTGARTTRPRPASVAPPPPSTRLSDVRRSATAQQSKRATPPPATQPPPTRTPKAAPPSPKVAKVIHIPSREATAQFPLPGFSSDGTNAQVIPLARVAPVDIAVPLVPTTPMPLTQLAPNEAAMPLTRRVFSRLVERTPGRPDTQQVLLAAPAPFVAEQPDEDLLAPYETSTLKTLRRLIARLLG